VNERTTVPTSFFISAGAPLNSHKPNYSLDALTPAVIEFLGFFKNPDILFGVQGNWNTIIGGFMVNPNVNNVDAAPEWAYNISEYLKYITYRNFAYIANYEDFKMAVEFLKNKCGGEYPNATLMQLTHSYNVEQSGALSELIVGKKQPVLVYFDGLAGLAYREDLMRRDYVRNDGYITAIEYDSYIYYMVSGQNSPEENFTLRSVLAEPNARPFHYIAY